jgi:hypothetical protein
VTSTRTPKETLTALRKLWREMPRGAPRRCYNTLLQNIGDMDDGGLDRDLPAHLVDDELEDRVVRETWLFLRRIPRAAVPGVLDYFTDDAAQKVWPGEHAIRCCGVIATVDRQRGVVRVARPRTAGRGRRPDPQVVAALREIGIRAREAPVVWTDLLLAETSTIACPGCRAERAVRK